MNRFELTSQKVDDLVSPGALRYRFWKIPDISLVDSTRFTVTGAMLKRIDMIAYQAYGDPRLWWVIAEVNDISNPLRDLVAGTTLKIPTLQAVTAALAYEKTG